MFTGTVFSSTADSFLNQPVQTGQRVFRVFGGDAYGYGRSWTRVDPFEISNYRNQAGLPSIPGINGYSGGQLNSGGFVVEGTITNNSGVVARPANPLHGNVGGIDELIFPNPQTQIQIDRVYGVNPPF